MTGNDSGSGVPADVIGFDPQVLFRLVWFIP